MMKYSAITVAALAAVASAQDISIFPSCSLPCITDAVSKTTTCAITDFACVCKNMDALTTAATPCVVEKCGIDVAVGQVLPATKEFCAGVGSGSSSSAAVTTTETSSVATTTETSSVATTTETSSAVESTTKSATVSVTESTTETETSTAAVTPSSRTPTTATTAHTNGTATKTASSTPSQVTAGAAIKGSIGTVAMLMLGAAAAAL